MVNFIKLIFLISLLITISSCFAIDNPDTPDYVNDFLSDAQKYEDKIAQCSCNSAELRTLYAEFNSFLEQRLSHSVRLINHFTKAEAKERFKESHTAWQAFSQKETAFVTANWTKKSFGTSYLLSRLSYMATIKKQRVVSIYHYAKNYPPL